MPGAREATRRRTTLALVAAPLLAFASAAGPYAVGTRPLDVATATTPVDTDAPAGKLLLMLDASGSMKEPDPSGTTKMQAAKTALNKVVDGLPEGSQVGLRVYGSTYRPGMSKADACKDTTLVHPINELDKAGLTSAIAGFQANGETPIAYSVGQAAQDLGTDGSRHIILVSDGEESCAADPCPEIAKIAKTGVSLQIDTVGFGVNPAARTQLQCIAGAANGQYYDAADAKQLGDSLNSLSARAVRGFSVSGTPVKGGIELRGAPTISAGQYVDDIADDTQRYYRVTRRPGGTLRVSATVPAATHNDYGPHDDVRLELSTVDGTPCLLLPWHSPLAAGSRGPIAFHVMVVPKSASTQSVAQCDAASELVLRLDRTKDTLQRTDPSTPLELLVVDEPPVESTAGLPAADLHHDTISPSSPAGDAVRVAAGMNFGDAPLLAPGQYADTIATGETALYRVHLDYGQRARVSVFPSTPEKLVVVRATMLTPDRAPIEDRVSGGQNTTASFQRSLGTRTMLAATPEVRYLNRSASQSGTPLQAASLPGDYVLVISTGAPTVGGLYGMNGTPLDISFRVEVDGAPQPGPRFADGAAPTGVPGASGSGGAGADASSDSAVALPAQNAGAGAGGPNPLVVVVAGVGILAGLGGLVTAYVRRGRG